MSKPPLCSTRMNACTMHCISNTFVTILETAISASIMDPPAKRLKVPGGYKQHAQWYGDPTLGSSGSSSAGSALARLLVSKWSWGHMSTPLIQEIAAAAVQDGLRHPVVEVIAKLGSSGRHPNHMHQDLLRKLHPSHISTSLSQFQVEYQNQRLSQHVLWPHELFATLYHKHHDVFMSNIIGGDKGNPNKFWGAVKNQGRYKNHPITEKANHLDFDNPIALHGDGVTFWGVSKC